MTPAGRSASVDDSLFWDLAEPLLASGEAEEGTLMGFPCLRTTGTFFASLEHRTGDLIVKIAATRVDQLIDDGTGLPFAPAGRRFREWVEIPERDAELWQALLDEARAFVSGKSA